MAHGGSKVVSRRNCILARDTEPYQVRGRKIQSKKGKKKNLEFLGADDQLRAAAFCDQLLIFTASRVQLVSNLLDRKFLLASESGLVLE